MHLGGMVPAVMGSTPSMDGQQFHKFQHSVPRTGVANEFDVSPAGVTMSPPTAYANHANHRMRQSFGGRATRSHGQAGLPMPQKNSSEMGWQPRTLGAHRYGASSLESTPDPTHHAPLEDPPLMMGIHRLGRHRAGSTYTLPCGAHKCRRRAARCSGSGGRRMKGAYM